MARAGKLAGSPWHPTYLSCNDNNDSRRHKSRCMHYIRENGNCNRIAKRCYNSAQCEYYIEKVVSSQSKEAPSPSIRTSKKITPDIYNPNKKLLGKIIIHNVFGKGTIIHIQGNFAVAAFDKHGDKNLNLDICTKKNLICFFED